MTPEEAIHAIDGLRVEVRTAQDLLIVGKLPRPQAVARIQLARTTMEAIRFQIVAAAIIEGLAPGP